MDLQDVAQFWGEDLAISTSGDLGVVSGQDRSRQRVLRRLMTPRGAYLFHLRYGGGLGDEVGRVSEPAKVKGRMLGQLRRERSVARTPAPTVALTVIDRGIAAQLSFVDQTTRKPVALAFTVRD